jgi:hypothetical protein|tara:strand:+ start:575 stop:1006 length:432 start_codon:yes stop_codon:yes gene_type:complete
MSSRPKSNDVYKKQGLEVKKKIEARGKLTPKEEIDKAKELLRKEVLRGTAGNLRRAFKAFGQGVDVEFMISFVGMEITRLAQSLEEGEAPDYRYTSAMTKYLEQMRRLIIVREGSASFIPEQISVLLESAEEDEDVSDRPEFT